jgi:hypothetical protein
MNHVFELTKSSNLSTFLGGLIGFTIFVGLLESKKMGKILYRNDKFRINGLILYLKSPFHQKFLWYPQLWKHNWVMMTGCGTLIGYILSNYI